MSRLTNSQLEDELETRSDEELGSRLKEYVSENNHQGWDGFARRDVTGLRRMLEDFLLFVVHYEG